MNLCVNARDSMLKGGQLTVCTANTEVSAEEPLPHPDAVAGRYVVLSVIDTGTGIPPDLLTRIFEPFFTTKSPDKGTGLGLSTVAQIVKRHKGFLQVQSEKGRGTQFRVFLPSAEAAETTGSEPSRLNWSFGNGELILIVDDEQSVVELAKSVLETSGYRVLTAPNGFEAITRFDAHT